MPAGLHTGLDSNLPLSLILEDPDPQLTATALTGVSRPPHLKYEEPVKGWQLEDGRQVDELHVTLDPGVGGSQAR